jgi:hypothetical protein
MWPSQIPGYNSGNLSIVADSVWTSKPFVNFRYKNVHYSFSILLDDRSKASSKTIPLNSEI